MNTEISERVVALRELLQGIRIDARCFNEYDEKEFDAALLRLDAYEKERSATIAIVAAPDGKEPEAWRTRVADQTVNMVLNMPDRWFSLFTTFSKGGFLRIPSVQDIMKHTEKSVYFSSFTLKEDVKRGIHLECHGVNSSKIVCVHTSSGSESIDGYRHVNFMTATGSVYYGSGETLADSETKRLFNKLPTIDTA